MKKIEHPLFSFKVPDNFDEPIISETIVLARNSSVPYSVHPNQVRLAFEQIKDLDNDDITGDTLPDKMVNYYLKKEFQESFTAVKESTISDCKTLTMSAKIRTEVRGIAYNLHYQYAIIFTDATHFISFSAVHEITEDGKLETWIANVLDSLEIHGDEKLRKETILAHEKRFNALVGDDTGEELDDDYEEINNELHKETALKIHEAPTIPKDGKEVFTIGRFNFEFITKETKMLIAVYSKELLIDVHAKIAKKKEAIKAQVLEEYHDNGKVKIVIPCNGLHYHGTPKGILQFNESISVAPLFMKISTEGLHDERSFNGKISFENGWFLLKGDMVLNYAYWAAFKGEMNLKEEDISLPIEIAKKVSFDNLNWKEYKFTSIAETETSNPLEVCILTIKNPTFKKLPEIIYTFKNLESLTISGPSNNSADDKSLVLEIQAEIGNLTKLKSFQVNGILLEKLPETIDRLHNLERLDLYNCGLQSIPDSIFQLPKLIYLSLYGNKIEVLPEEINLPVLTTIHLESNELKTLPIALANQLKIYKIGLKGNPLKDLPAVFNEVDALDLAMDEKLRLLDYGYKGADGSGLVEWNDAAFWSQYDVDLLPEINEVIAKNKLEKHTIALRSLVKKGLSFNHEGAEDYSKIGNHRFGGMPDLPEHIPYPRFGDNWHDDKKDYIQEFIGQINCAEITHLQKYLPRTGILFFFLETIHNVYGEKANPGKVIYCEDTTELASGKRFKFSEDDYFEMFNTTGYKAYKVSASKINNSPSLYANRLNTHLFLNQALTLKSDDDFIKDSYELFEYPINGKNTFKYASNAYGFSQNEAPELQASLKKKGKPQDWIILLTVTSAGDMQWGDAGDLFFVIHKSDLAKGDFSNVFVTMESS